MNKQRKILVTSALPYANGSIHLGHLVEYIQTDIWVRFQKMQGNKVTYVCADDAHGTPIMLKADELGISPQKLIDDVHKEHSSDFSSFLVEFDNFYSTHSEENKKHAENIYLKLQENGYIFEKVITQAFDEEKQMFLPDRFVKGTCPKCKTEDQYGDNCESCGATYSPTDLINPKSALSGKPPIEKDSNHYFFDLPKLENFLKDWLNNSDIQPEIKNKMMEWFESGLNSWDISRDAPYWGFKIPNTENKFFYVWLDAPIGYIASFENYCIKNNLDFNEYFKEDSKTELYHFIGKDIAYFHTLFWPATLKGANLRTPTGVFCHGFLTVNGAKMSKSRGTFIKAQTYLEHLKPENLRYYYASKLSSSIEDIDLNFEDFKQKNNSDIVGKLVNLASRCAGFISKRFDGTLANSLGKPEVFNYAADIVKNKVTSLYEERNYAQAVREIMALADRANEYIDAEKPWVLAKDETQTENLHKVCTTGINLFYQLVIALKPVLPELSKDVEEFLNINIESFSFAEKPLLAHKINKFKPLAKRIEDKDIEALIESSKQNLQVKEDKPKTSNSSSKEINIDDFNKLDLRVAKVLDCDFIDGADKLLKFKLDVGKLGEKQVFSGIRKFYPNPKDLIGSKVILVANLAPRKMKFGISEGMILSSENKSGLRLLPADNEAIAGDKVK